MASIEAHNVCKTYASRDGDVVALDKVSLKVTDSEFVSILGPSGCGKSTLLRILDGLAKADSGTLLMDGRPIERPTQERGFVFQSFNLFPWRTVRGNIEFGMEIKGVPKSERHGVAQRLVELVGLAGFERKYPHELSGGMQQRVGIARALAIDPAVLLMDEPFGALDAQTREDMQDELLRVWAAARKTVLFVTHSIEEAIYLSDRVLIMTPRPGRILADLVIPFSRPRSESHRTLPEFSALRHDIHSRLKAVRPL
ncbi:MAG TPA: ABC transporter ATP-binding protein [Burkholderiales bacterium]|jgi:NitT/TauT family transport system ATP-binding protein|nr:ABC transporter ATP-binding protein [Burkholderiales bacterium]